MDTGQMGPRVPDAGADLLGLGQGESSLVGVACNTCHLGQQAQAVSREEGVGRREREEITGQEEICETCSVSGSTLPPLNTVFPSCGQLQVVMGGLH